MNYRRNKVFEIFYPNYKFKAIQDIPDSFFTEKGIKLAILDIDNTLVPYTSPTPTDNAKEFVKKLEKMGISCCFVSNNDKDRVELFCKELGEAEYIWKARKPLTYKLRRVLKKHGGNKKSTVLIGDQIFTDVLSAKLAGLSAVMVEPIEAKETPFFTVKRAMERIVLKNYDPKG